MSSLRGWASSSLSPSSAWASEQKAAAAGLAVLAAVLARWGWRDGAGVQAVSSAGGAGDCCHGSNCG